MNTINKVFISEIERVLGQKIYSGIRKEFINYYGAKNCAFYEKSNALVIYVDPYFDAVLEKSVNELKIILPIALKHYSLVELIFDDIIFILEFLSKMDDKLRNIANTFWTCQKEHRLQKKQEIPINGDEERLIEYLSTEYEGLFLEIQNVQNAYGILKLKKYNKKSLV